MGPNKEFIFGLTISEFQKFQNVLLKFKNPSKKEMSRGWVYARRKVQFLTMLVTRKKKFEKKKNMFKVQWDKTVGQLFGKAERPNFLNF
jgi:hypothetical protein